MSHESFTSWTLLLGWFVAGNGAPRLVDSRCIQYTVESPGSANDESWPLQHLDGTTAGRPAPLTESCTWNILKSTCHILFNVSRFVATCHLNCDSAEGYRRHLRSRKEPKRHVDKRFQRATYAGSLVCRNLFDLSKTIFSVGAITLRQPAGRRCFLRGPGHHWVTWCWDLKNRFSNKQVFCQAQKVWQTVQNWLARLEHSLRALWLSPHTLDFQANVRAAWKSCCVLRLSPGSCWTDRFGGGFVVRLWDCKCLYLWGTWLSWLNRDHENWSRI